MTETPKGDGLAPVTGTRPSSSDQPSLDNAVKWSLEGAAIDPADLLHIFDRLYRAPRARALPGSGLGLAIVRQVAEAHGGTVTAARAESGGSVFTLKLAVPVEPAVARTS
jgi:signal transduction histidine kinase